VSHDRAFEAPRAGLSRSLEDLSGTERPHLRESCHPRSGWRAPGLSIAAPVARRGAPRARPSAARQSGRGRATPLRRSPDPGVVKPRPCHRPSHQADGKCVPTDDNRVSTVCNRAASACTRFATSCTRFATACTWAATGCNSFATACNRIATGCNRSATSCNFIATARNRFASACNPPATGCTRTATARNFISTACNRSATGCTRMITSRNRAITRRNRTTTSADWGITPNCPILTSWPDRAKGCAALGGQRATAGCAAVWGNSRCGGPSGPPLPPNLSLGLGATVCPTIPQLAKLDQGIRAAGTQRHLEAKTGPRRNESPPNT